MKEIDRSAIIDAFVRLSNLLPDRESFLVFYDLATRTEPATPSRLSMEWGCMPSDMEDILGRLTELRLIQRDRITVRVPRVASEALEALRRLVEEQSLEGTFASAGDTAQVLIANTPFAQASTNNSTWCDFNRVGSILNEPRAAFQPQEAAVTNGTASYVVRRKDEDIVSGTRSHAYM